MDKVIKDFMQLRLDLGEAVMQQHSIERAIIQLTGGGCPYTFAREHGLQIRPVLQERSSCQDKTEEQHRGCPLCTKADSSILSTCWYSCVFTPADTADGLTD